MARARNGDFMAQNRRLSIWLDLANKTIVVFSNLCLALLAAVVALRVGGDLDILTFSFAFIGLVAIILLFMDKMFDKYQQLEDKYCP